MKCFITIIVILLIIWRLWAPCQLHRAKTNAEGWTPAKERAVVVMRNIPLKTKREYANLANILFMDKYQAGTVEIPDTAAREISEFYRHALIGTDRPPLDDATLAAITMDDPALATRVASSQASSRRLLRKEAEAHAISKADFVQMHIEANKENKNDLQNAHDSSVNLSMEELIKTKLDTKTDMQAIGEIDEYIGNDPQIRNGFMSMVNSQTTIYGCTEMQILSGVWKRNRKQSGQRAIDIKVAVGDALKDCVDRCSTGRVSRVVTSLAIVDPDPAFADVQTVDYRQNKVREQCQMLFDNAIKHAAASNKPRLRMLGRNFQDPVGSPEPDAQTKAEFDKKLITSMHAVCDANAGYMRDYQLQALKDECSYIVTSS